MKLETEHLRILPLDLVQMQLLLDGTPCLERNLHLNPSGQELDEHTHAAMTYLYNLARETPESFPWITNWQIILKSENVGIGSACFINVPDEAGAVEIGYGIHPAYRNHGYMTEALRAICNWALTQPGVTRVTAESEADNAASHRVLERTGFRPIGAMHWEKVAGIQILRAGYRDLPAILALQYRAYQSEARLLRDPAIPPLRQTLPELEEEFRAGVILKAVAEAGEIVGSVRAYARNGTTYIGKLMVAPERQRHGIGTRLLAAIETELPQPRCELFTSNLSVNNLKLYERNGYRRFREQAISPTLTMVYMEKYVTVPQPQVR